MRFDYNRTRCFTRASQSCEIFDRNKPPPSVRSLTDLQVYQGICAGITTTWIIQFLSELSDVAQTQSFAGSFEYLREQGALFHQHNRHRLLALPVAQRDVGAEIILEAVRGFLERRDGIRINRVAVHKVSRLNVPLPSRRWAAYVSCDGHATGLGYDGSAYFIMDPQNGLYTYPNLAACDLDMAEYCQAATRFNDEHTFSLHVYTALGVV